MRNPIVKANGRRDSISFCKCVATAFAFATLEAQVGGEIPLYVCNCNGIRERQVRAAIEAGATRPAEVFKIHGCKVQCARCVCEMREMIDESREALRFAAE